MEEIVSKSYDGKMRRLYKKVCKICDSEFLLPKHVYNRRSCCSVKCRGLACRSKVEVICAWCNKSFNRTPSDLKRSKSGLYFCDRSCKDSAQTIYGGLKEIMPSHYGLGNGKFDYRDRALKKYGPKCKQCGYETYIQMLDVDHIDSNRDHNEVENLQVLCIWCHWLKTRGVPIHNWNGCIS